jgi:predicted XRE-type DNA-binding protein
MHQTQNFQIFDSVWDAIADSPEEASHLRMRAEFMNAIGERVIQWKVTQAEAASRLGITQPRLNALLKGKISRFSLDALVTLAYRAGLNPKVKLAKAA